MNDPGAASVHVISHTHWDREWYQPASRFRQRLVEVIDELLDDPPPQGASFLLDGQTVLIEDYLSVRPERRERLAALLRDGRLEAGPWYVLADELIPGGEALVRNLLEGARTLKALGATAPPVLYCPDSFGHPARLPTLAAEFGCPLVILWRGYGGARWPRGDAVRWRAGEGRHVLVLHLPPDGYEFGSNLPTGESQAAERWKRMRETLEPRNSLGVLLVLNGADHHARQHALADALVALRRAAAPTPVTADSMRGFAALALERASQRELPAITGELRDSYGYTWTLGGTLASRTAQKRRNALAERLLVREAEPWAALARRREGRTFRPHLHAAWRTLLLVHPHDTLCGCVPDEVARAADARLDSATTQAAGIVADAVAALVGHNFARARERQPMWRPVLVVRNPSVRARGGVAEVEILAKIADVSVGPGSAAQKSATQRTHGNLSIGDGLPLQVLERGERFDLIESPRHYPDCDLVEVRRSLTWVPPLPGYGTRALDIRQGESEIPDDLPAVRTDGLRLFNGLIEASCDEEGRVSLLDADGNSMSDCFGFEHEADLGDLYTPSLRGRPVTSARLRKQRLLHRGPLRAAIEQHWTLRVPRAAGEHRPVDLDITCVIALDAGARFVRLRVSGINSAADHRLRLLVHTAIDEPQVLADAAFGPVSRVSLLVPAADSSMERPLATAPLHRWVAVHDSARSLALISDGLAEYEAMVDGTIAITLVRGVGELSREDLPERPGRAGWPVATPQAQCLGPFAAEFAVLPLSAMSKDTLMAIEYAAEDALVPITGTTLRSAIRLPAPTNGIELEGDGLVFSAVKDSSDGEWTVLRCVNVLERETRGVWRTGFRVTEARLSRLDEAPGDPLPVVEQAISFSAPARAVSTILVR